MNILLAVDDSTHSQSTAQFLSRVHFPLRSKLILFMVVESPTSSTKDWDAQAKIAHDYAVKKAWDFVNKMGETCWKPGLKIIPLVGMGIPGATILDAIEQHDIDLTVLGTHGRTGRERFLLGSVSEWVLTEAPCSVLIIRGLSDNRRTSSSSRMKILLGVDGSEDAKAALNHIRQLKFPASTQVTVCSTINKKNILGTNLTAHSGKSDTAELRKLASGIQESQKHRTENMLSEYAHNLEKNGLSVQQKLAFGHPAEELLTLAEKKKCDLIVVGSRGVTGLRKFFLGSVSNKVACHAPCSVLVVRKPSKPKKSQQHK